MRNKFEQSITKQLDNNKIPWLYEKDKLEYYIKAYYVPDLILKNNIILEIKGYFRAEARRKMLAVKKSHPYLDIRFVFFNKNAPIQGAQKRKDNTRMTCEEWALKHGFKYCEKEIPKEWLDEFND